VPAAIRGISVGGRNLYESVAFGDSPPSAVQLDAATAVLESLDVGCAAKLANARHLVVRLAAATTVAAVASASAVAGARTDSTPPIKLIRAQPKIVNAACRMAQSGVHDRVACPTLIPESRYIHRSGMWGSLSYPPDLWWITVNNGDNGPGYVHWMAGGGDMKAIARHVLSDSMNEVKGQPKLVGVRGLSGYRVSIYHYPPYPAGGPNGGHSLALVPCLGRGYFASIHRSIYGDYHSQVAAMAVDLARRSGCR
jgi:hypothetical protein